METGLPLNLTTDQIIAIIWGFFGLMIAIAVLSSIPVFLESYNRSQWLKSAKKRYGKEFSSSDVSILCHDYEPTGPTIFQARKIKGPNGNNTINITIGENTYSQVRLENKKFLYVGDKELPVLENAKFVGKL
jgi:hypothetical protein